ncbi:MAG: cytochrome C [Deltaproteobacteria bacterium]|nr:cytochrome C [Deltaproteobacteria bacterium]
MRKQLLILSLFVLPVLAAQAETPQERGRYLSVIAGCNDCHTSGFGQSGGKLPESQWLTGDSTGWHGPWGTTYAVNLRSLVSNLTPQAWITLARNSNARPPMPTYILKAMPDSDLLALYEFIRSLGNNPTVIPAALPPGQKPQTAYINFTPVLPEK